VVPGAARREETGRPVDALTIGIDIGGTFTDVAMVSAGGESYKVGALRRVAETGHDRRLGTVAQRGDAEQ
jgi:N-methylhydantoinase A/oxoprolinase/acetone carboxylase beta subunit